MNQTNSVLRSVFSEAIEIVDPAARAAFLDSACRGDPALRSRVEQLLAAEARAGNFLAERPANFDTRAEAVGSRIGRYRLLERIGQGGYGVVYLAEQEEPVRRQIALKIIRLGMDTGAVVARFETERQVLAVMDHPNIARVFDGGATEAGRPFFVMEFVRGMPITDYCAQKRLTVNQRLELFIHVCHGVQHAHQKGIIHRDLKPSNILVTEHDGAPMPKVIDFGIAKATGPSQEANLTRGHDLIGTPAYMSPEQVQFDRDIDTRSDIYGLGVILYELMAGHPPFDPKALTKVGLEEMRRMIHEVDPPRPSTRMEEDFKGQSARTSGPSRQQISELRGDVDWIVMRCLEKDRARRYESADALATDIRRHLEHQPISARPPTAWYRFRKTVRRNRGAYAATAAVALILVLGVIASNWQAIRATRAEREQSRLRGLAEAKEAQSHQQLVRLSVVTGNAAQEGDLATGPLWYVEALRLDAGNPEAERIHRQRIKAAFSHLPQLELMWFHIGPVMTIAFSPDGTRLVSGGRDHTARVWDVASGQPLTSELKHESSVNFARFTPDGRQVITLCQLGDVNFWDIQTGDRRLTLGRRSGLRNCPLSADARRVAIPVRGGVQIYDTASGLPAGPLVGLESEARFLFFSPDETLLIAGCADSRVRIWNFAEARIVAEWPPHTEPLVRMKLSPDGQTLATQCDRETRLWDVNSGKLLSGLPVLYHYEPDFSADGRWLATCGWAQPAQVWNVPTGERLGSPMNHRAGTSCVLFSPDHTRIATTSWDRTARLWDARTGLPASPSLVHLGGARCGAFSPDGTRLVTGEQHGLVRVWNLPNRSLQRLQLRHAGEVTTVKWSSDGSRLLTCSLDGLARVWDARRGQQLFELKHPVGVSSGLFYDGGKQVLTSCKDGMIRLWRLDGEAREPRVLVANQNGDFEPQVSPDGKWLLTATKGQSPLISDIQTGRPILELPPVPRLRAAQFSRDGRRLATAGGTAAQLWDSENGRQVGATMSHVGTVFTARFSPDGRRIVTACCPETELPRAAQMWDAETGQPIGPPLMHMDGVLAAEYSPDGTRVATCGEDNSAMIWDATTGERLTPTLQHSIHVTQLKFSPDGRCLLTVSDDGAVRVWETATGEPVTGSLGHGVRIRSTDWSPDGHELATATESGLVRVWDLSPAKQSLQELRRAAELLSSQRIGTNHVVVTLTVDELKERWQAAGGALQQPQR